MKPHNLLIAVFFCIVTLAGCSHTYTPQTNQDLLKENWIHKVNLDVKPWAHNADNWFLTGEPTAMERAIKTAPNDAAMSMMSVKVSQFTRVALNGCFQVQIVGEQDNNNVMILGPNEAVRQLDVQVWDDTLCITQLRDSKGNFANLKNVTVRIGVRNLRHLKVSGSVFIEGRGINSSGLTIHSSNADDMLLGGQINLVKVNNTGAGTISVFDAYTPCLDISQHGNGRVNVSGRIGIHSLENIGTGTVSIIGADTDDLSINASGNSLTSIAGYADLKKLFVTGSSCVYVFWVHSRNTFVDLHDDARIGLAGTVTTMNANLTENARLGAQYLHTHAVYIQTHNNSHANIAADKKIFASANENSSIYYFGSPNIVSRYTTESASVIQAWADTYALPIPANAPAIVQVARYK